MGDIALLSDCHEWLERNGFSSKVSDPTNEFVSQFYGKTALWETKKSRGIVVEAEDDDDYIVIELSRLDAGFKYTQIVATLAGCI